MFYSGTARGFGFVFRYGNRDGSGSDLWFGNGS